MKKIRRKRNKPERKVLSGFGVSILKESKNIGLNTLSNALISKALGFAQLSWRTMLTDMSKRKWNFCLNNRRNKKRWKSKKKDTDSESKDMTSTIELTVIQKNQKDKDLVKSVEVVEVVHARSFLHQMKFKSIDQTWDKGKKLKNSKL